MRLKCGDKVILTQWHEIGNFKKNQIVEFVKYTHHKIGMFKDDEGLVEYLVPPLYEKVENIT